MKINVRTICTKVGLELLIYKIPEQALLSRAMDWNPDNKQWPYGKEARTKGMENGERGMKDQEGKTQDIVETEEFPGGAESHMEQLGDL